MRSFSHAIKLLLFFFCIFFYVNLFLKDERGHFRDPTDQQPEKKKKKRKRKACDNPTAPHDPDTNPPPNPPSPTPQEVTNPEETHPTDQPPTAPHIPDTDPPPNPPSPTPQEVTDPEETHPTDQPPTAPHIPDIDPPDIPPRPTPRPTRPLPPIPVPPPIPQRPKNYVKTTKEEFRKKDKALKQKIKELEQELNKLYLNRDHIESCIGLFQDEREHFLNIVVEPDEPEKKLESVPEPPQNESPPPSTNRSFLEMLISSLVSSIPTDNRWSRSNYDRASYRQPIRGGSSPKRSESPGPTAFPLFGGSTRRQRSPSRERDTRPPSPPMAASSPPSGGGHGGQHCLCYDCMKERGYV